jgi:hypothetical protein
MIEKFNDVEVRGTGVVMSSMFEQIKKMHAVDPDLAGELAISAIELVLTGQISSDDAMIDMLLAPAKIITDNNVQRYEARKENSKGKKIKDMRLDELAELYKAGVRQKEIAERLHLTQQTVSYRLGLIKTNYPELLREELEVMLPIGEPAAQTILPKSECLPKNLQTNSDVYQNTNKNTNNEEKCLYEDENADVDEGEKYTKDTFRF